MEARYGWLLYALAAVGLFCIASLLRSVGMTVWDGRRRHPFVSVLLLVRDQAEIIEGLLHQLLLPHLFGWYPAFDWEIVVVDEDSSDETRAILAKMNQRHLFLRWVCRSEVEGAPAVESIAFGRELCRSPVVFLIDLRERVDVAEVHAAVACLFRGPASPTCRDAQRPASSVR